jgi:signal peptidase complex subunit 2
LALGYTAVAIAGAAFYIDYTMGWEKTKYATFWAVLFYFAINSVLTYWIWAVEKGQVFVGELDGAKVSVERLVFLTF